MKTHRSNFFGSKLILFIGVIVFAVMLGVIGFCFSNANADSVNDSDNATTINIPVTNLAYDFRPAMAIQYSDWSESPDPSLKYIKMYGEPIYTIDNQDYDWNDLTGSSYVTASDKIMEIHLCTNIDSQNLYRTWKFTIEEQYNWFIDDGNEISQITQNVKLFSNKNYRFSFGQPQSFVVESSETEVSEVGFIYKPFWTEQEEYESVELPFKYELTGVPVEAKAWFDDSKDNVFSLNIEFTDKFNKTSKCTFYITGIYERYFEWLYNGNLVSTDPNNPTSIDVTGNVLNTFALRYEPYPEPFTNFKIKGYVQDERENPIPNAEIGFYNSDVDYCFDDPLLVAYSREDGSFELDGCYSGQKDPYNFVFTHGARNFENAGPWLAEEFDYHDIKDGVYEMKYPVTLRDANVTYCCDTQHHRYFQLILAYNESGEEAEVIYDRNFEYICMMANELSLNNEEGLAYDVLEDGTLLFEFGNQSITIKPYVEEGYKFSNYLVNDKTTYVAGDKIPVDQIVEDEGVAHVAINYVENGQGGGGGQSAEIDANAQTGDSGVYAAIALAALVMAAGAVYILRRKNESC